MALKRWTSPLLQVGEGTNSGVLSPVSEAKSVALALPAALPQAGEFDALLASFAIRGVALEIHDSQENRYDHPCSHAA
jgi:hypothetical protein